MGLTCPIGIHRWSGHQCSVCGKVDSLRANGQLFVAAEKGDANAVTCPPGGSAYQESWLHRLDTAPLATVSIPPKHKDFDYNGCYYPPKSPRGGEVWH